MGLYYVGISRDYYRYILLYRGYNYREYIPLFPTNHQQEKHRQTERSLIFALPHQIYQAVTKLDSSSWLAQGLRAIPYIPNISQQHRLTHPDKYLKASSGRAAVSGPMGWM